MALSQPPRATLSTLVGFCDLYLQGLRVSLNHLLPSLRYLMCACVRVLCVCTRAYMCRECAHACMWVLCICMSPSKVASRRNGPDGMETISVPGVSHHMSAGQRAQLLYVPLAQKVTLTPAFYQKWLGVHLFWRTSEESSLWGIPLGLQGGKMLLGFCGLSECSSPKRFWGGVDKNILVLKDLHLKYKVLTCLPPGSLGLASGPQPTTAQRPAFALQQVALCSAKGIHTFAWEHPWFREHSTNEAGSPLPFSPLCCPGGEWRANGSPLCCPLLRTQRWLHALLWHFFSPFFICFLSFLLSLFPPALSALGMQPNAKHGN